MSSINPTEADRPKIRFQKVQDDIRVACQRAGRDPSSVKLIAVSKTISDDGVVPVIEAGHRAFGENRVQEASAKWPPLKALHPEIELHLIGPLQSNKTRQAIALFDAIHSLDRLKLCAALARECARQNRSPEIFVQINTGLEPQKAGVSPAEADVFLAACRQQYKLNIVGLMCIPPVDEPAVKHFSLLAEIATRNNLPYLSMGMTADFQEAIALGATHVRVGSAIFGARAHSQKT